MKFAFNSGPEIDNARDRSTSPTKRERERESEGKYENVKNTYSCEESRNEYQKFEREPGEGNARAFAASSLGASDESKKQCLAKLTGECSAV